MLTHPDNALLCQVQPGEPMHDVVKRYWLPVLPVHLVAERNGDPVRITVLGRDYVVFRDSEGRVGCLAEGCCHRGASLALGRVEGGGIRCLYHGWKYAIDGGLLETPNADLEQVRGRIRQPAYPAREAGGLVWVYFGEAQKQPPFPSIPYFDLPPDRIVVQEIFIDANFVQIMEGLVDSSHVGVLHQDAVNRQLRPGGSAGTSDAVYRQFISDLSPRIKSEDTDFGFHYAALRELKSDDGISTVARVTAYAMPFFNFPPTNSTMIAGVPIDSHRTQLIEVNWDWDEPFDAARAERVLAHHGISDEILDRCHLSRKTRHLPGGPCRANNWEQDRAAMRRGETFSGLPNFQPEDAAISRSLGPISDRSKENLVPADQAVVRMRRIMLESARRVQRGEDPIGLSPSQVARGLQGMIAEGTDWQSVLTRKEIWRRAFGQFAKKLESVATVR
jgi:phthalate 4,5-dioxygenase